MLQVKTKDEQTHTDRKGQKENPAGRMSQRVGKNPEHAKNQLAAAASASLQEGAHTAWDFPNILRELI